MVRSTNALAQRLAAVYVGATLSTAAVALASPAQLAQPETSAAPPLMTVLPTPGAVAEETTHEATGVRSLWLTNNVRLHYRFMNDRPNHVIVAMVAAGGEIEETPANRGITQAAAIGLASPATASLTSEALRERARGKRVSIGGRPAPDALVLTIMGEASDLEFGLQQAHLMLTEPVVEEASLGLWREGMRQFAEIRAQQAEGAISDVIASTLYPPGEIRFTPVTPEQADAISAEQATAWLRRIVSTGPMEVSIVGDIPPERAMELALRYLGSLPTRTRIGEGTLAELRTIRRPTGPLKVVREVASPVPIAMVRAGFFSADTRDLRDVRLLGVASRILTSRARVQLADKQKLIEAPVFTSVPAAEYPGFGHFYLAGRVDPGHASELAGAVRSLLETFAASGPTQEEMAGVLGTLVETLERQVLDPAFWSTRLTTLTYRGTSLDELLKSRQAYEGFSAADVREAFARYCTPERRYELIVSPSK